MGLPLVTRAEYKAYAGIASTNQDAQIDSIIPKVSALVKSICKRTFIDYVNDATSETFSGGYFFVLKEPSLLAIQSVEISYDYGVTYTVLTEGIDYVYDNESQAVVPINAPFPNRVNGYKVTYTAGYETLPEDLKVAVLDLVTYYLKNDGAVHSPKAPGTNTVQIEYITNATVPAHIRRVLDLYMASLY